MKAPVSIIEHRHRFLITVYDMVDIILLTSFLILTFKFWGLWFA